MQDLLLIRGIALHSRLEDAHRSACKIRQGAYLLSGVEEIGESACSQLGTLPGNLTLPNGLKRIARWAFNETEFPGSNGLSIPDSVTSIGMSAFAACHISGNLKLSSSMKTLEPSVFFANYFTGDVVFPNSITKVEGTALLNARFDNIYLPCSLKADGIDSDFLFGIESTCKVWAANASQAQKLKSGWLNDLTTVAVYSGGTAPASYRPHSPLAATGAKAATCTSSGTKAYWTCGTCGALLADSAGRSTTTASSLAVPVNSSAHSWSSPKWSWTVEGSKATATFACSWNKGHTETLNAAIRSGSNASGVLYTATVVHAGKTFTSTYQRKNVTSVKLSAEAFTYTAAVIKPKVSVYAGATLLKEGSDYTLTWSEGCTNPGTYRVTVNGTGAYCGSLASSFVINPKGTSLSRLISAKKAFTVKWMKQAGTTSGYMLRYATSRGMKGAKSKMVGKASATSVKISKLKAGKRYYVQIQTFAKVNGVKYYSAWSKAKSVVVRR